MTVRWLFSVMMSHYPCLPSVCVLRVCVHTRVHRNVEAEGQPQMPLIRCHPPFILISVWYRASQWNSMRRLGRMASMLWRSTCVHPHPPHKCMPPRPNLFIFNCTSRHQLWKADTLPAKLFSQSPEIIHFKRMVEIKGKNNFKEILSDPEQRGPSPYPVPSAPALELACLIWVMQRGVMGSDTPLCVSAPLILWPR